MEGHFGYVRYPLASMVNGSAVLEQKMPGNVDFLEWIRMYKTVKGNSKASFGSRLLEMGAKYLRQRFVKRRGRATRSSLR